MRKATQQEVVARLLARCTRDEGDCLIWQGPATPRGYGQSKAHGCNIYVHRYMFEAAQGPIPNGMVIDHLCRKPRCCNPDHLEAVSQKENVRRGDCAGIQKARHASVTHCPKGHPYTEANTAIWGGRRGCRTCHREARYWAKPAQRPLGARL